MNTEKTMILIVRFAAVIAFFLAAGGVLDIGLYLWRERNDFSNVGTDGLGKSAILIGVLTVVGFLLWKSSHRLGPWLCSEPGRRRRAPQSDSPRQPSGDAE